MDGWLRPPVTAAPVSFANQKPRLEFSSQLTNPEVVFTVSELIWQHFKTAPILTQAQGTGTGGCGGFLLGYCDSDKYYGSSEDDQQ